MTLSDLSQQHADTVAAARHLKLRIAKDYKSYRALIRKKKALAVAINTAEELRHTTQACLSPTQVMAGFQQVREAIK